MRFIWSMLYISLALFFTQSLCANNFTVTNTNDTGPGSLRDAIVSANARVGKDTLLFDFGIAGVKTITTVTALPNITDTLFIDGSSDPGYAGMPLIEINGNGLATVFQILPTAPYSHIHAVAVNNTSFIGVRIGANHCTLTGSFIGTDPTGTIAVNNDFTGVGIYNSNQTLVGGTGPNEGNLISGNRGSGIFMYQSDTALIIGNKIGTDISGTLAIPNANGIALNNTNHVQVGGSTPAERNIVSGNTNGIYFSTDSDNNSIYGNYVGTDLTGANMLANTHQGVYVRGDSNQVGGTLPGQGNLISGNTQHGIQVSGNLTGGFYPRGNTIQANLVGTDLSGTVAIPNGYGINLNHGCEGTLIGGSTPAARNLVSGNTRQGIRLHIADSTYMYGNYVGTDISGSVGLGNQDAGIDVSWSTKTFIGNATANEANVIAASASHGIYIHHVSDSNYVQHNYIGTDATGLLNLANTRNGVQVGDRSTHTEIGGVLAGEGNIIANNLNGGVEINGVTSFDNRILGNSIYDHPLEGIRLANGNNMQTAPSVTGFITGPTSTISGTFTSLPNTTYRMEFFTSNTGDQGKTFIGAANITTDATGFYGVNETFPVTITAAQPIVTVTATDPDGNTSPFGIEVILNAEIQDFSVAELDFQTAQLRWAFPENGENVSFRIEHQAPGQAFELIGERDDYSTQEQQRLYTFDVHDLSQGIHHFRLQKVSKTGNSTYSETLSIHLSQETPYHLVFENPIQESSVLDLRVNQTQRVAITLLDIQGKTIASIFKGNLDEGLTQRISLAELRTQSSGIYFLRIRGSFFEANRKVLVE